MKERLTFVGFLLILIFSILGGALIGPVNNSLPCKDKLMLVQAWRFIPLSFLYMLLLPVYILIQRLRGVPLTIFSYKKENPNKCRIIAVIFLTNVMTLGWSYGHTLGTIYTVQQHAYILTNIHGVFTLVFLMATCQRTHKLEKFGTLIVIAGALLMVFDPEAIRKGEEVNPVANALILFTNIPGAFLWIGMSYLLDQIDIVSVCGTQIFVTELYLIVISLTFEGAEFSMDAKVGLFGFMN